MRNMVEEGGLLNQCFPALCWAMNELQVSGGIAFLSSPLGMLFLYISSARSLLVVCICSTSILVFFSRYLERNTS